MASIEQDTVDQEIQDLFQTATDTGWAWKNKKAKPAKDALRKALFAAQGNRCAYCRRRIKDMLGHSELDHILPKEKFGNEDRWTSNNVADRKNTGGYEAFTFEPFNLVLTCKPCNNAKGTYDCRSDRSGEPSPAYVVGDEEYYEWIHPFVHNYDDHITLLKDLIYQPANGSTKGDAVITACSLESVGAVERNACELKVKEAKTIAKAFMLLMEEHEFHSWDALVAIVHNQFPHETVEKIQESGTLIKEFWEAQI
ncbi:5-methylcytosine-specific restriction endonuclease McrA [Ensifer adhaerens]|uniref:5-methylcytosine-specific restriction endonuclease McrA n=1 Tax=Ensifer adhaerens TaxID=106592 RepID=A0ACC5SYY0_ENSAD|nr:HNH endonuclease signature motif containing protein [Ensifer adhaerens]MBP1874045.1 5-methylcytosine-specific restriction endonuclease McrA [Ensifer adhaerens]